MIKRRHIKLKLSVAILLLTSTVIFGQINLDQGLVGFFPFDGNANDESSFNINGTVNNAILTTGINDNINSAYYFNGINANINCDTFSRNISDTVTVSAWIKTTSSGYHWIAGKYDWTIDRGFQLGIKNKRVFLAGRNNSGQYISALSTILVNDGNWHHVMGIVYSNTWEIWVDCVLDKVFYSNSSNPDLTSSEPLTIGNYNLGDEGNHAYFLGSIDEVRVYNRLLSNEEKEILCNLIPTGITESNDKKFIKTYPNPAKSFIAIEAGEINLGKIEVFDLSGLKLKTFELTNEIDMSDFEAEIYLIKIFDTNGNMVQTVKVIKIN